MYIAHMVTHESILSLDWYGNGTEGWIWSLHNYNIQTLGFCVVYLLDSNFCFLFVCLFQTRDLPARSKGKGGGKIKESIKKNARSQ